MFPCSPLGKCGRINLSGQNDPAVMHLSYFQLSQACAARTDSANRRISCETVRDIADWRNFAKSLQRKAFLQQLPAEKMAEIVAHSCVTIQCHMPPSQDTNVQDHDATTQCSYACAWIDHIKNPISTCQCFVGIKIPNVTEIVPGCVARMLVY